MGRWWGRSGAPETHRSPGRSAAQAVRWDGDPSVPPAFERAATLFNDYPRSQDLDVLTGAIELFTWVLPRTPARHPLRAMVLNNSGIAHRWLYERTGDADMLAEAVTLGRAAVDATPRDSADHAKRMNNLASALMARGDRESLAEAVEARRTVVAATPNDHPQRGGRWNNLAAALLEQARATGDRGVLAESLRAVRRGLGAVSSDDPSRSMLLGTLAVVLQESASRGGAVAELAEALDRLREQEPELPPGPQLAGCWRNLAGVLLDLWERTGEADVIDEAVAYARRAAAGGEDGRDLGTRRTLARALSAAFDRDGERETLAEAIALLREVEEEAARHRPRRVDERGKLVAALRQMHERTREREPIEEAVALGRRAVADPDLSSTQRVDHLGALGPALHRLFDVTRDDGLLSEAVQAGRDASVLIPDGDTDRGVVLANLAITVRYLAERTDDPGGLSEAVTLAQEAVTASGDDPAHRSHALNTLSGALESLFDLTGEPGSLQRAIDASRAAVASAPPGHSSVALYLTNLGSRLRQWFQTTGELAALAESITVGREAVAAAPLDLPNRVNDLDSLAGVLFRWFERTGEWAAHREAVERSEEAIGSVPQDDPRRAVYISNLAGNLLVASERAEDGDTWARLIARAVVLGREAVATTTPDNPGTPGVLMNHASILRESAQKTGRSAEMAEAVETARRAVAALPADHVGRSSFLNNLGWALGDLLSMTHDEAVLAEARSVWSRSARYSTSPVWDRFQACRAAGTLEMAQGSAADALAWFERAVELMPQVASRALIRSDREHRLGRLAGFPADVAASAVAAERPARAVELLEQTRGLLLGEELDVRGETNDLRSTLPDLAREFSDLRERIAAAERSAVASSTALRRAATAVTDVDMARTGTEVGLRRRELSRAWDDLLARIRARTGFERFLLPPTIADLVSAANDGPVVLVYTSRWRADAIVIRPDPTRPVEVVELEQLDRDETYRRAARLRAAARDRDQSAIHEILEWLGEAVSEPVLDRLESTGVLVPGSRMWWCPVGVLASLPLHAAGRHQNPTPRTALDRAVSSYAITLRALERARSRPTRAGTARRSVVVSMPETPGATALAGAREEARHVSELLGAALVLEGPAADHASVTAALPGRAVAHFACHGVSDPSDPARSALLLHDHLSAPLTVTNLMGLELGGAELAYLSACSTGTTSVALADEAVHLTAAVHLAGYRRVIGTLWEIGDAVAVRIAGRVYARITDAGNGPAAELSAAALHNALVAERNAYPALPARWAAHLHLGP